MADAKPGDTVKVHYTGKLEDGTVFDSSADREPLQFTIGEGNVIPGFENAVVGMNPGEIKTEKIPCVDAYGPRHEEMIQTIERSAIPADIAVQEGQQLQVSQPGGEALVVTVAEVTDDAVTLDGNHMLAGKDLVFEIELVEIA
jgi:peptidylprolyl isomerase